MTNNADGYDQAPPFYNSPSNPDLAANGQNPSIVPAMDPSISVADPTPPQTGQSLGFASSAQFLASFPRVPARGTVTLTGSVTVGDTSFIELANGVLPGGRAQFATVSITGDTLATIAQRLADMINASAVMLKYQVSALLTTVAGNPTISISWTGPVGNFTLMSSWSFKSTETATVTSGSSPTAGNVATLGISGGLPSNTGLITINGTATAGDQLTVTFGNPLLPNGTKSLALTVPGSPTLAGLATSLAAGINADPDLTGQLSMLAEANGATVFFSYANNVGGVGVIGSAKRAATETVSVIFSAGSAPSPLAPSPNPSSIATIGGSATTGDNVTLTFYSPSLGGKITITYTVQGGDTTTSIAAGLVALINANSALQSGGFSAGNLANVVTTTWPFVLGQVGPTGFATASASETFAIQSAIQSVSVSYTVQGGDSVTNVATGLKAAILANPVLLNAGFFATSAAGVVHIFYNGGLSPLIFSESVSPGATIAIALANASQANTITIGGSVTAGDELWAKFVDVNLPTGGEYSFVTAVGGDTTTTLATKLAAQINANDVLGNAGITATPSGAVVTVLIDGTYSDPTITAWAIVGEQTLTITGTMTPGDAIDISLTVAGLPGGAHEVQYIVASTDTTATILAASLATAINDDGVLAANDVVAGSSGAVLSIAVPGHLGPLTFASYVNGTTDVTATGTPTSTEMPSITVTDSGLVGGFTTYAYTVGGADTNTTIAAGLAALITADSAAAALGITATSALAVVAVNSISLNQTTVTATSSTNTTLTVTGGPTEIATPGAGPTETATVVQNTGSEVLTPTSPLTGGSGPIIPLINFPFSNGLAADGKSVESSIVSDFFAGKPALVGYNTLQLLIAGRQPIY